ncbi:short-chain dehydrogenase/reductase-like protein SDR [Microthyrium microscopicum]|uniref:Short-chain dehydrogenase/reductase-like protein SDR n=1 Tax=Microthyrium microscopicum TaxID=703497 RepID=A0A6A6UIQ2_9PEZI|nr:short-chain dehydrogenase/reductase-like protein SDR [Microthyrium microscopicum]
MIETVLVVGATGNIGVAAVKAALRTKRHVLAVVRNQTSADKLFKHVGVREGITTVEADVRSETGLQEVVDKAKAGKLPAFQHVYSTVGTMDMTSPIQNLSTSAFREVMSIAVESNYFAYRATVPYLIDQAKEDSTWTLMTGAAGTSGWAGVTAVAQGALFSLANVACRENAKTNIRFNEVYLACRVDYDSVAEGKGVISSSKFADNYEQILSRPDIKGCRVSVLKPEDIEELKFEKKLA